MQRTTATPLAYPQVSRFQGSKKDRPTRLTWMALLPALLFFLLTPLARAQYRASIEGVVTDSTGAVIPGATLTLTDSGTGAKSTTTSNGEGLYNFGGLAPDRYTLVVDMKGFQSKTLQNVQVTPEQANALNVQLDISGATTSVTVDASSAEVIDTENATISGTVDANQIQHMPSFGRDVFQLAQLAPGSFGDASQSAGGGSYSLPGTQGPGGSGSNSGIFSTENGPQVLAAGGQYENNGLSIDGISVTSAVWGGTSIITPSEDSIDNVHVVTNAYDAETGRFSGAQVEVTSKSGTNQAHGSLFFTAHRPGLNAYQRYNGPGFYGTGTPSDRGLQRDNDQFNQYGGSVGGPFWKDKLFGFFAYETERINSTTTATGWYDTPQFDALAPANSIANTYLTFPGAAVNAVGQINNVSCATAGLQEGVNCRTVSGGLNLGSPLTSALGSQDLTYVSSTQPGVGSGLSDVADIAEYTTANPTSTQGDQYNGRLDAQLRPQDRLSFAIYWVPYSSNFLNGPARLYNVFHHDQVNDAFAVIWNHTFSPNFLNEARANAAGWRWNEQTTNPQAPFGLPSDSVANVGPEITNFSSFGAPGASHLDQWTYTYRDVATWTHGRHSIRFGGELNRLYYLNENLGGARPNYTFFNLWDFLNDAPEAEANSNFDPLTGQPTVNRQDNRENLWGFFVQDDFKVLPTLTLNLGLRYTYNGSLYSKENNINVVVPGAGSALLTGLSVPTRQNLWDPQKTNLGPQFGFAWTPGPTKGKMVVRGGFGLNYNQEEIAISANGNNNPPAIISPNFTSPDATHINPDIVYGVSSDVHSFVGFPTNPNAIESFGPNNLPTTGSIGVTAFPTSLPTQYTYHYSLDTQYDLGHQIVASVGYQGSLSRHTYYHYDLDAVAAVAGIPFNPAVNSVNYFGNEGHGNYHALLLELKHQFSHQFQADAQFTWAKSMDTSSAPYSEDPYPYNPTLSYGRSDYNVGKAFKIFGMWQPVFFHGGSRVARVSEAVAGGWSISGIYNLHTGFPWTPVYTNISAPLYCSTCSGYQSLRPAAYLGGAGHDNSNDAFKSGPNTPSGTNKNFPNAATAGNALTYFSAPAYTPAATFPAQGPAPQAPGVSRNSFDGPGYQDLDASLSKAFGLPHIPMTGSEGTKLEIRVDTFNLLNNLNFETGSVSNNISSPNFGQATAALGARTVSIQARFSF